MNAGDILKDTAAGRVYTFLRRQKGRWVDSWTMALETQTTAVGTRVSEEREGVRKHGLPYLVEHKQVGQRHFYRVVDAGASSKTSEGEAA